MEKRYWYITPEDYEVAAKNGIKKDTVIQRVRKLGWDIDSAITKKIKRLNIPQEIVDKAKEMGIDRGTLLRRIRDGWTMEEACSTEVKKVGRPRKRPDWIYEAAKENGIRLATVNHRINWGWDLERACTEKVKQKNI